MPAPRGPQAKHERNLERNLDVRPPAPVREGREPTSAEAGDADVAAKLAREAAVREAVRRVADRGGGGSEGR